MTADALRSKLGVRDSGARGRLMAVTDAGNEKLLIVLE